jgi:hypothetical protein
MTGRTLGLALSLAIVGPGQAAAQRPVDVQGRADLDFGIMVAGVPTSVAPFPDGGQFRIRGAWGAEMQIQMTLPGALTGPGGSAPLTFGPTDGRHGPLPFNLGLQTFDPRLPLTIVMTIFQTHYIWLGGTVSPPIQLTAGTYTATIVLTASYTGN